MSKEKDTLPDWERMFEVLTNIQTQVQETNQRLERLESRMDSIEKRVESIENRVNSIEKCVVLLDNRMTSQEKRFDSLETRMGTLENRMGTLETRLTEGFEQMRLRFLNFEAREVKLESTAYAAISVAKDAHAQLILLREEVNAHLIANFGKPKPDPLLSL